MDIPYAASTASTDPQLWSVLVPVIVAALIVGVIIWAVRTSRRGKIRAYDRETDRAVRDARRGKKSE